MSEVKLDMKETNEALDAIVLAVKAGKKVRDIVKDGVDASDFPKAIELITAEIGNVPVYSAGVKDVKKVEEEIKDLDKAELIALIMKVVGAVEEIEKA
jgi:hypothetical protein